MGERKVLNKYYPRSFNPTRLPRIKQPKGTRCFQVRMMLPMSIRCNTCGYYIYKGTKFNSRKESVIGKTYLGIQIFRYYFKCTHCSVELTMKTDPQNSDFVVEYGASRNYEPLHAKDEEANKEKRKRDSEETGDAMKFLENRTLNSKEEKLEGEAEDEALREAIFQGPRAIIIRRIEDDDIDEDEDEELLNHQAKRKVSTDQGNSTDILTQKSIFDSSKDKASNAAKVSSVPVDKSSAKEQKQE